MLDSCPKCNRHRWNKRKTRKKFLSDGCIICTMYEKYKFKPKNHAAQKYKTTGRYCNHSDEVTIENVQIFAVDDRQTNKNKKIRNNDDYLPFI